MGRIRQPKGRRAGLAVYGAAVLAVVLLNAAAWNSTAFCDWYIAHIFPVWVGTYGRLTGLFSFSVGEWMIGAGVVLLTAALLLGLVWIGIGAGLGLRRGLLALYALREGHGETAEKGQSGQAQAPWGETAGERPGGLEPRGRCRGAGGAFCRFSAGFARFFLWTLLCVGLIMTLNCFILYHASTFSEHYFGEDTGDYTFEELLAVYNMVAGECNTLAGRMERDENGMVLYSGSTGPEGEALDMADMARAMMARLGESYPQLNGYYPRPKALLSSDFMCQQYMQGYYFPFSMEANYNDVMHILNKPATMCHELAHLRGYIYEDEANFIGYLACVQSEDAFFRYAGYLSVLVYLNNDLYRAWESSPDACGEVMERTPPVAVDSRVWEDNIFVAEEEWDRINGKALIDTEIVDKAADVFIDTNLKVNGIADGAVSYSRVVKLLLQYYRQIGLPRGDVDAAAGADEKIQTGWLKTGGMWNGS